VSVPVTLGKHEFEVIAQPWAYAVYKLRAVIEGVQGKAAGVTEADIDNIIAFLGTGIYDALCVLIPDLPKKMPACEFNGFKSIEAWEAGEIDEAALRESATMPQIIEAFEVCLKINGGAKFAKATGLVDPKLLKAAITEWLAEFLLANSPSSQLPSGASASTSSGETPRTPTRNGSGSRSRVSKP
jgi:hypothetical protein